MFCHLWYERHAGPLPSKLIDHFRAAVGRAGSGNYQALNNDALLATIAQRDVPDAGCQVVREELAPARPKTRAARLRQPAESVG